MKQNWLYPLLAALLVAGIGYYYFQQQNKAMPYGDDTTEIEMTTPEDTEEETMEESVSPSAAEDPSPSTNTSTEIDAMFGKLDAGSTSDLSDLEY